MTSKSFAFVFIFVFVVVVVVASVGERVDLHGPSLVVGVDLIVVGVPERRDDLAGRHAERLAHRPDVLAGVDVHDAPVDESRGILQGFVAALGGGVRAVVEIAAVGPRYRRRHLEHVVAR
jgi:chloramphenicol 3-O-phosphotransferase